jgi:hypothetical protein
MIRDLVKTTVFSEEELMGLARRIGAVDSERTKRLVQQLANMAVAMGLRPGTLPGAIVALAVSVCTKCRHARHDRGGG